MTTRVLIAPNARAWIHQEAQYLTTYSPAAARRFRRALDNAWRLLREHPNAGPPGAFPDTRRLVVGEYIISYRRRGADLEVIAVRHGRQEDA
jgi:plasmid stabilization system protein ParE